MVTRQTRFMGNDNPIVSSIASCPVLASCHPAGILSHLQTGGWRHRNHRKVALWARAGSVAGEFSRVSPRYHARITEAKRTVRPEQEARERRPDLALLAWRPGGPGVAIKQI